MLFKYIGGKYPTPVLKLRKFCRNYDFKNHLPRESTADQRRPIHSNPQMERKSAGNSNADEMVNVQYIEYFRFAMLRMCPSNKTEVKLQLHTMRRTFFRTLGVLNKSKNVTLFSFPFSYSIIADF